ncbi:MAG: DNA-processing protein DprA, partial [Gordonia sp. (in: high G+C Gram-positive bacteria)]|uniref:DNA-processing protein DprA n=1 Tax=Gordonia sp. (in: high G+C Gram-positive bacteria) TaxID=84139 RepID=UPI003BB58D9A
LALWVRGSASPALLSGPVIGIVGSRAATSYGDQVAGRLGGDLAAANWAVVSGGAYGIDGAAHRGALAAGGSTVAVLACGIDRDYPAGHAGLLAEVARSGLVISEYAPGTTAGKHRFLTRNRLVAALSSALVVVEAGRRSGAANTAAWARHLGRPLGAVPGPVSSAMSVGCHQMIADGQANLVTDAASTIALVRIDGHDNHLPSPKRSTDELPPDQFAVIEALPARGGLSLTEVAFVAGVPVDRVRTALARLELTGRVTSSGGLWGRGDTGLSR